jgi:hypothetical protein
MNEHDDWEPPQWLMEALACIGIAVLSGAFWWLVIS